MMKSASFIGIVSVFALLCGCQQLNTDLGKINNGLSNISGQKPTAPVSTATGSKKSIKNAWNVSDSEALAWLGQSQPTWDDNGKLKGVNWYDFWKQQIKAKTTLAKNAYRACHNNPTSGENCQTYWQAYSMSKSEESRYWGKKMDNDA
ncbi:MAG: hypothetical protein COV52_09725 [Gammaproteobacteria bacterium CG11_big_fil_rev_8_21_14_0_20_46_22]|nr:MAG: hypothetical protein COV52_09725 [Gammaproteobacteria bacterium CG11_big_fil_rev_8_21_14_0_20_46_22]